MKQSAVQLFLLLCMQKYNKNTKRHEHCATLWLILKGYYKKQWLFSIDGSESRSRFNLEIFQWLQGPLFTCKIRDAAPRKSHKKSEKISQGVIMATTGISNAR